MPIQQLDLRGLQCPLPVLKIRHYLKKIKTHQKIWIWCDDPMATIDIPYFCKTAKQKLLQQQTGENNSHWFLIERSEKEIK